MQRPAPSVRAARDADFAVPGGDTPEIEAHCGTAVGENAVSQGEQAVTVMPSSSCSSRISAWRTVSPASACRREFPVASVDLAFRALGEQEFAALARSMTAAATRPRGSLVLLRIGFSLAGQFLANCQAVRPLAWHLRPSAQFSASRSLAAMTASATPSSARRMLEDGQVVVLAQR